MGIGALFFRERAARASPAAAEKRRATAAKMAHAPRRYKGTAAFSPALLVKPGPSH
jgi:hypothetical protein